MSMEIHLTGDMATALKDDTQRFLQDISQGPAQCRPIDEPHAGEDLKGDAITVATLILTVPGAVVATLDLAERFRLSRKIQGLLKKIKESNGDAVLHTDGEDPLDLKTAGVDEVLARIKK